VRRRLQERLREVWEVPLTIIQAGPGYGKTTALASFLAEQQHASAWYSVGEDDADPLSFLLHLVHALRRVNPLIGDKALSVLQEGEGPSRPWHVAVEELINDMVFSDQPETLIVLDDFHLVDAVPQICSMVEHMVDHLPPQVHLIISSRRRPPLPGLARWRARADLLEITQDDLLFRPSEVEALFRDHYGWDLTSDQVTALTRRTEGWIIALQLVWQGLKKGSPLGEVWSDQGGSQDALFGYLAKEVLDRQKPFVRRFLLTTSVLERLTPEACNALMEVDNSAQVLAELEENGLFISQVPERGYRYHQLFHQFLQEQARKDQAVWRQNHLRAAAHFHETGEPEEAAVHYLAAGDAAAAADALLEAARGLLDSGRIEVLLSLLSRLPESVVSQRPALLLYWGDGLRLTSRFDEALAYYERAAVAFRDRGDRVGLCRALIGQGQVYLDTIQPGKADGLLRQALELADAVSDAERATLMALIAENETNSGRPEHAARFAQMAAQQRPLRDEFEVRAHLRTGRLAAGLGILERLARADRGRPARSHREAPLLLSLFAAIMGDHERSQVSAEEGIALGQAKGSPFVEAVGHIRLGHALQLNPIASVEEAARSYRTSIEMMDRLNVVRGKSEPLAGLALLMGHRAGDWNQARRYGQEGAEIAHAARDLWFFGYSLLALGVSAFVTDHPDEADRYLTEAENTLQQAGDACGLATARIWRALLARRQEDWDAFDRHFGLALAAAEANGYGFLFQRPTLWGVRDPQVLIPLLAEARQRGVKPDYAGWLLSEMGITNPELHPGFTLRIRTLGTFAVYRGRHEITAKEWQREKAKQLFQLLVTHRTQLLQKEQIIEMLWPGADPSTAYRDFKVAMNALWSALEPNRAARSGSFFVLRQGSAYGLNLTSGFWLDADEFANQVNRGLTLMSRGQHEDGARALRRGLDLYQGDYLEALRYEDWCIEEWERLQVLYLRATEALAHYAVERGDYEGAIHLCDRIIARDRGWEEAYRLLMFSYYRLGNRAMALRVFDRCVQNLAEELGIEPAPATRQLYERVRSSQRD